MARKVIIHNHLPAFVTKDRTAHLRTQDESTLERASGIRQAMTGANDANQAYKIKVRRLATGADYNIRIFAASQEAAEARAKVRAAAMERIPEQKLREMESRGNGVFRIVTSMLDPDQSRPNFDSKPDKSANSKAGKQRDIHGVVNISWKDGSKPGWYYSGGGTSDGPFMTSEEAFEEASSYGGANDVSYQETEGKAAAEGGKALSSCPYPQGSNPRSQWIRGYNSVPQLSKAAADRRARRA